VTLNGYVPALIAFDRHLRRSFCLAHRRFEHYPRHGLYGGQMVMQSVGVPGVSEPIQQISQPLHMGAIEMRSEDGELAPIDLSTEVGKYGRDGIEVAGNMDVSKQVECRQFGG
jgi:hypothetical protein